MKSAVLHLFSLGNPKNAILKTNFRHPEPGFSLPELGLGNFFILQSSFIGGFRLVVLSVGDHVLFRKSLGSLKLPVPGRHRSFLGIPPSPSHIDLRLDLIVLQAIILIIQAHQEIPRMNRISHVSGHFDNSSPYPRSHIEEKRRFEGSRKNPASLEISPL